MANSTVDSVREYILGVFQVDKSTVWIKETAGLSKYLENSTELTSKQEARVLAKVHEELSQEVDKSEQGPPPEDMEEGIQTADLDDSLTQIEEKVVEDGSKEALMSWLDSADDRELRRVWLFKLKRHPATNLEYIKKELTALFEDPKFEPTKFDFEDLPDFSEEEWEDVLELVVKQKLNSAPSKYEKEYFLTRGEVLSMVSHLGENRADSHKAYQLRQLALILREGEDYTLQLKEITRLLKVELEPLAPGTVTLVSRDLSTWPDLPNRDKKKPKSIETTIQGNEAPKTTEEPADVGLPIKLDPPDRDTSLEEDFIEEVEEGDTQPFQTIPEVIEDLEEISHEDELEDPVLEGIIDEEEPQPDEGQMETEPAVTVEIAETEEPKMSEGSRIFMIISLVVAGLFLAVCLGIVSALFVILITQ